MPYDVHAKPAFLKDTPTPTLEVRPFHTRNVPVWIGEVDLDDISGWLGNPRTEMLADQWESNCGRPPTDDEMLDIVLAANDGKEGTKIKELASNILNNGVRMPVVLTYEGILLDGNRRYYACRHLFKQMAPPDQRHRFEAIPAIVLPPNVGQDVKNAIMTEFNFLSDWRVEWPYYVKAMMVYHDHVDEGLQREDLERKYGVAWKDLQNWIRAAKLCERFLNHHRDPGTGQPTHLAQRFAYEHFIMFDEMARDYRAKLYDDSNFRQAVFDLLLDGYNGTNKGNHRFRSSKDVQRLDEIWDNPDNAWKVLEAEAGPRAVESALFVVSQTKADNAPAPDPNPTMRTVVRKLEQLVGMDAWSSVDAALLRRFRELVQEVPALDVDQGPYVEQMVDWLDGRTALQIAQMDAVTLASLRAALDRVTTMATAVTEPVRELK